MITEEQREWAFGVINPGEGYNGIYPDVVEEILSYQELDQAIVVIAIDQGNPPVVPTKKLAFRFEYADEDYQELTKHLIKLLNAEEVESGGTANFTAPTEIDWRNIVDDLDWWADDCGDACGV